MVHKRLIIALIVFLIGTLNVWAYDPTSAYEVQSVEGFTVLINPSLKTHPNEFEEALKELRKQTRAINQVVKQNPLKELHKVRIWMEWENRKVGAAEFHPSAKWLTENGYNPEKAGCIELSNARNFVKWSQGEQPWMLLHELSHAYHFLVLGENNTDIHLAYQNAMDSKLYESVDYIHGGKKRAYATTNEKEYFAEISEAYFGKNDFFPFNRKELESHDPTGYALMLRVWDAK